MLLIWDEVQGSHCSPFHSDLKYFFSLSRFVIWSGSGNKGALPFIVDPRHWVAPLPLLVTRFVLVLLAAELRSLFLSGTSVWPCKQ